MQTSLIAVLITASLGLFGCASTNQSVAPTVHTTAAIPSEELASAPSCAGLRDHVANKSFFAQKSVLSVERIQQKHYVGARNYVSAPAGVEIIIAAEPTQHREFLGRLARCHVDTYAMTDRSPGDDPLSVPGATYEIKSLDGAYAIRVTAADWDAAREIQARAARLR